MGHNNFFYPSEQVETLMDDTGCETISYIGGGEQYTAVKIPASAIYSNAEHAHSIVVWVNRGAIRAA